MPGSITALVFFVCSLCGAWACHRSTADPDLPSAGAPGAAGPDVLLIVVDTLRADHLGTYGYPLASSPRIDVLADEGVVFERAIAASSMTAPSHASIFTSRYTRQHSIGYVNGATRLQDAVTLAETFQEAGYATAAFVGNLLLKRRLGFDRGFEVYDDDLPRRERNRIGFFERIAQQTTERALAWLASQGEDPIFLWVHYQDPHGPYDPPAPFAGHFRIAPRKGEEPLPVLDDNESIGGIPAYQVVGEQRLPSEYESRYADEILYADRWIGALLDAFDSRTSERGGVVLLTADHGESLGEGYRYFLHGTVSTPDVAHVPFILKAPGIPPGRRRDLVSHVDVMPTLLGLAGLAPPAGARGIALGPYLRNGRPVSERLVYCDAGAELSAYRGGRFLRVKGVESPWIAASGSPAPEPRPAWLMYEWPAKASWTRTATDSTWKPEIRSYYSEVVPMRTARGWETGDLERLRALGYLAPGAGSRP